MRVGACVQKRATSLIAISDDIVMVNQQGIALLEIIISWGLVSGILVALTSMQMLSATYSLDGLSKTQFVLSLASHGECLYRLRQDVSEFNMDAYIADCTKAIQRTQESNEEKYLSVESEYSDGRLSIAHHWTDSRQIQQKLSVVVAL